MDRTRLILTTAALVLLSHLATGPVLAANQTAEDVARVRRILDAQLRAIRSLEVRWKVEYIDGAVWEYETKLQGNRFRYSELTRIVKQASPLPMEVAFDGTHSFSRSELGLVGRAVGGSDQKKHIFPPTHILFDFIRYSLWPEPGMEVVMPPVSSSMISRNGRQLICIRFEHLERPAVMEAYFDPASGCMPVDITTTVDGQPYFELRNVRFKELVTSGNRIFYPVYFERYSYSNGALTNRSTTTIDESSLRINRQIPVEEFRIQPFPSENVRDVTADRTIPPVDPNWKPAAESLPFPWREVWLHATKGATQDSSPRTPGLAPTSSVPAKPTPLPKPVEQSRPLASAGWAAGLLGVVLLAVSGIWAWRRHVPT